MEWSAFKVLGKLKPVDPRRRMTPAQGRERPISGRCVNQFDFPFGGHDEAAGGPILFQVRP